MGTPWYISIKVTHYGCHRKSKNPSMDPIMGAKSTTKPNDGTRYGCHFNFMAPVMGAGKSKYDISAEHRGMGGLARMEGHGEANQGWAASGKDAAANVDPVRAGDTAAHYRAQHYEQLPGVIPGEGVA